jgi:monoamine oxidase
MSLGKLSKCAMAGAMALCLHGCENNEGRHDRPRCDERHDDEGYDVVIVGAGFGGAYASHLLKKRNPCTRVLILEKDSDSGGKLRGPVCRPGFDFCQEFAAMRLMPKDPSIPELAEEHDLLEEMNLTLVEVPYDSTGVIWYYNNTVVTHDMEHGLVPMPESVGGNRTVKDIIKSVKTDYFSEYASTCSNSTWKVGCNPNILERHDVIDKSVTDWFLARGATMEEFKLWESEMGYQFYNENVSAASWLNMGKLHSTNAGRRVQYFLKDSWLALPRELLRTSGVEVNYDTEVDSVRTTDAADCRVSVSTRNGTRLCAGNVILTTPFGMPSIDSVSEDRRAAIRDSAVHYSHFKAFLTWDTEDVWWRGESARGGLNLTGGKSTTDMTIRQVHYYSNDTLLVYPGCCDPADVLGRMMTENRTAGARYIFDQIKELHTPLVGGAIIPEPNWTKTVWKWFEGTGSSKWRKGVNQEYAMNQILNGKMDNSGIYMASDVFSEFPAWIVGNMMSIKKTVALLDDVLALDD